MGAWKKPRTTLVAWLPIVLLLHSSSVQAIAIGREFRAGDTSYAQPAEAKVHSRDARRGVQLRWAALFQEDVDTRGPEASSETHGTARGHADLGAPIQRHAKHKVQHAQLLNKPGLWFIMATIIIFIGASVVRMEYSGGAQAAEAKSLSGQEPEQRILAFSAEGFFRFVVAVVGLNFSMLFWGIAQEYMMTTEYEDGAGLAEKMPSALCLVLFNRICTTLFSGSLLYAEGGREAFNTPVRRVAALPAGTNLLASFCQYQSLAYVSFPLQTAAKSAKLLPVILLSSLRGKRHTALDYAEGLVIVSALMVFGFETDGANGEAEEVSSKSIGALLLCGLLIFDSTTPHLQDYMFQRHAGLSLIQATFSMALSATGISLVTLMCNGQLVASLRFLARHPEAALHLLVLSLCSTMTQFLISFTIKYFGPVIFILITTTRQLISVCISSVLFMHRITTLAWLAALVVFCTVVGRTARKPKSGGSSSDSSQAASSPRIPGRSPSLVDLLADKDSSWRLLVCILGISLPLGFYSVAQEFMTTHTFDGELFSYPLFLIAANRTGASLFALGALKMQGLPIYSADMHLTIFPAATNLVATFCQYRALAYLRYPVQALMKAVKVLPVMLCGRILKNRNYNALDYCEAIVITVLVCFFTWSFNQDKEALSAAAGTLPGILLMAGYLLSDSLTCNVEDHIYQRVHMDPGQMLLGMQAVAGLAGWGALAVSGNIGPAVLFLANHPKAILHVAVLVLAEACGAYACTVTVRLFGPAVFTLLLMSHQIFSLLVSVALFNHKVSSVSCSCVVVVTLVMLTSSLRRATTPCSAPHQGELKDAK